MIAKRWIRYKNNDHFEVIPKDWCDFFKTCPNEQQILILDKINEKENGIFFVCYMLFFGLGILVGYFMATKPPF